MNRQKIDFGKSFPAFETVQYRDGIAQSLKNGWIDQDSSYRKWPGLTVFGDFTGANPVQGIYEDAGGNVVAICNGAVAKVASNGTLTAGASTGVGTTALASFCEDGANIFVANGGSIYKITYAVPSYAALTGNAPTNASKLTFQDGFVIAAGGTVVGDVTFSDDKAGNYTAADSWEVFNCEALADACNNVLCKWGELNAFGTKSLEVNYNSGSLTGPWMRSNAPILMNGLAAPNSLVVIGDTMYWLTIMDRMFRIVRYVGRQIEVVSGPYDGVLQDLTSPSTARGFAVAWKGNPFYLIDFPSDNLTIAYNLTTNTWSQIGLYSGGVYTGWIGNCATYVDGWKKQLVGSRYGGKIFTLSGTSDDGLAVRFELTSGNISWGTDAWKENVDVLWKWKCENASNSFRVQYADDGGSFSTEQTVTPDAYTNNTFYATTRRMGMYRSRQWRIIHDSISYGFTFVGAEERFKVGIN